MRRLPGHGFGKFEFFDPEREKFRQKLPRGRSFNMERRRDFAIFKAQIRRLHVLFARKSQRGRRPAAV